MLLHSFLFPSVPPFLKGFPFPSSLLLPFIFILAACSGGTGVQDRFGGTSGDDGESEDYYRSDHFRHEDHIYKDRIRTVKLHPKDWEQGEPVIELGTGERLLLSFDDLDGDRKDYRYRFIHCNADWEASSLPESKYLDGFYDDRLQEYRYSFDTEESYTHYQLEIPNERTEISRSGNYLLYIYRENGEEEPILTRRFMVVEERPVQIKNVRVTRPTDMDRFDSGQQLRFKLSFADMEVSNPTRDFKVLIQQNGRWDNVAFDPPVSKPGRTELVYGEQGDATVFEGANEYRPFDTKILSENSQQVERVWRDSNLIDHVRLKTDEVRRNRGYFSDQDINGRFLVRSRVASDHDLSAEYVKVHFNLKRKSPLVGGNLYIFGGLSDYRCLPSHRLDYDRESKSYQATLYLKQGYYEYLYAFLPDDASHGQFQEIEGSFYETENDYRILVYYRGTSDRADRLVKMKEVDSREEMGG